MTHSRMSLAAVAGFLCLSAVGWTAHAKSLAWYRFEGATGTATQDTVYSNSVDAAKYPMYAGVCAYNGNNKYSKATLSYTEANMPYATNAFTTVDVTDPLNEICLPNDKSVAVNISYTNGVFADSRFNPHGELFIDDHADLQLQTFTLEFFVRIPYQTANWRCLVCRPGRVYNDHNQAFKLFFNDPGRLTALTVTAIEGDPLFDNNGIATNTVTYTANATLWSYMPYLRDDKWHHLAIVVDGDAKTANLYLDYHLEGSVTYKGKLYYDPGYPICFGGVPQCSYFSFAGSFDEIRLSDEALTPDQMLGFVRKRDAKYYSAVDERTLLYYPFDGSFETCSYGAEMASGEKTYVPAFANQAIAGSFLDVDATIATKSSATNAATPQLTVDHPGSTARFGLRETNALANAQAVYVTTNGVPACDYSCPLMATTSSGSSTRNTAMDLFSDSCTIETFYKAGYPGPFSLVTTESTSFLCIYQCFCVNTKQNSDWNTRCITATLEGYNLIDPSKTDSTAWGIAGYLSDNNWHHLALVYDHANKRADFYLDYKWKTGADVPTFAPKLSSDSALKGLVMGGYYWQARSLCDMKLDDVRVTRGVLRPHEFLTTIPVETDAGTQLARATFDKTNEIGPYVDFYTAATKSGTVVQSKARAGRVIQERTGDTVVNTNDVGSLQFTSGTLTYEGHDILAAEDQFTVEMFLRTDSSVAEEGLARINRNVFRATEVTNLVTWALAFADTEGHIKVKVDTDDALAQTVTFGGDSFADGQWHHLGLVVAHDTANAANTRLSLYRDGTLVGTEVVTGHVLTKPYRMNFMLGAGEKGAANYTGFIDELRISSPVIDPDYFMSVAKRGFAMIVR